MCDSVVVPATHGLLAVAESWVVIMLCRLAKQYLRQLEQEDDDDKEERCGAIDCCASILLIYMPGRDCWCKCIWGVMQR